MAQAKLEKTNQITRIIERIPAYNGSATGLHSFIQHVDEIIAIAEPADQVYANIITRSIRGRVIDKANDALELYNTPNQWDSIKKNLIAHFADKRDESVLIQDLHNICQGNDSIEIYFAKISEILNNLKNWAKINEPLAVIQKSSWYDKMGLNIFCCKLREPMGSHVRSMQPQDLPTARTICIREQSLAGLRYNHKPVLHQKPNPPPRNFMPYKPQSFNPHAYAHPKPTHNNNNFNNHNKGPNPYYNHRPFTQQPRQILPKPEPMDTTSNLNKFKQPTLGTLGQQNQQQYNKPQYRPLNYQFQQNGPPRFQARELFNIEETEDYYSSSMPYYEEPQEEYIQNEIPQYESEQDETPIVEIEDEDFHQRSSEIPAS